PPDRVRGVRVHRGGGRDPRPAAFLVGVPVLQDAPALRAQPRLAVDPGTVAGRAAAALPVAQRGLPPPAFHRGLGEHDVLVDAPLAGRPAQDLAGGPGEAAVDPRRDELVRLRRVPGQEPGPDRLAHGLVVGPVHALALGDRPGPHPPGALRPGRQRRTRGPRMEVGRPGAGAGPAAGGTRPGARGGAPGAGPGRPCRCRPRPPRPLRARPRRGRRYAGPAPRGPRRGAGGKRRVPDLAVPPSRTPPRSAAGPVRRPPKPAGVPPSPARVA